MKPKIDSFELFVRCVRIVFIDFGNFHDFLDNSLPEDIFCWQAIFFSVSPVAWTVCFFMNRKSFSVRAFFTSDGRQSNS